MKKLSDYTKKYIQKSMVPPNLPITSQVTKKGS